MNNLFVIATNAFNSLFNPTASKISCKIQIHGKTFLVFAARQKINNLKKMYSVVEFAYNNSDSKGIALVHNDWFVNDNHTRVICPPSNWDKNARNINPKISTLKWKIDKCKVLSKEISKYLF